MVIGALYIHLIHDKIRQMKGVAQERLFHRSAVSFLVYKVPPASDHLAD